MTFLPLSSMVPLLSLDGGPRRAPQAPRTRRCPGAAGAPLEISTALGPKTDPSGPPARAGASGRAGARSVALQDEREPVRELRHSTKEQAALSREHRAREATFDKPAPRVAEVWDRGGDVPLRRREPRHAPRADEVVDVLTGDELLDDGETRQRPVVVERDVAASRRLRRLGVVQLE